MMIFFPLASLSIALFLLGGWGLRNLSSLSFVAGMPADRLARRKRQMRRGSHLCRAVGVVFMLVAALALLVPPGSGGAS